MEVIMVDITVVIIAVSTKDMATKEGMAIRANMGIMVDIRAATENTTMQ